MKRISIVILVLLLIVSNNLIASDYQPIVLNPDYNHDKWQTRPRDHIFKFAAYTSSFDGVDNNDSDTDSDRWGIPEWVAFEIKKLEVDHPLAKRPKWMTDITGPGFFGKSPAMWLGQDGENKAAIPDAFFKIVIRETDTYEQVETLAFLIPNILPKSNRNLNNFLTSVDRIEDLTGLDFLTVLDDKIEERAEEKQPESLDW